MAVNTSRFAVRFRKLRELLCEGRSHFEQAYNDFEFHITIIYEMSLFIWDVCEWSQNKSIAFQGTVTRRENHGKACVKNTQT